MEILRPLRLRYFSPEELLRLFCFEDAGSDSTLRWPEGVSTKSKYRLIGNSVNVLVVSALIEYLCQRYGFRSVEEPWQENAERTRLISLSPNHYHQPPFLGIDCFLSPTISSIFILTLNVFASYLMHLSTSSFSAARARTLRQTSSLSKTS